jgi:hypothetical protein
LVFRWTTWSWNFRDWGKHGKLTRENFRGKIRTKFDAKKLSE